MRQTWKTWGETHKARVRLSSVVDFFPRTSNSTELDSLSRPQTSLFFFWSFHLTLQVSMQLLGDDVLNLNDNVMFSYFGWVWLFNIGLW